MEDDDEHMDEQAGGQVDRLSEGQTDGRTQEDGQAGG